MSHILYILAANYDRKHLENSKIELEISWKTPGFFLPKEWEPCNMCGLHSSGLNLRGLLYHACVCLLPVKFNILLLSLLGCATCAVFSRHEQLWHLSLNVLESDNWIYIQWQFSVPCKYLKINPVI